MDNLKTVIERSNLIKGPAGFLYVKDEGAGETPIVFLHSFGGSSSHWKDQLQHLRENYRVIAFDFRGHGRSDSPGDNDYSAESLAADLAAVVDNLNLEDFVLAGHSMGGAAAIAYAGKNPQKISGLVLTGTPGKSSPEQSKQIIASLESDAYEKVMADYTKQLLTHAKPEVDISVKKGINKLSKETTLNIVKAMFQFDPLPALHRYKGPTLIIATAREDQQPTALHHQVPGVEKKIIDGTSHWIQMDKPQEFNGLLDDFLRTIEK
jgi:pimeloyl-ACP methyl ester carboxylesterase